MPWLLADDRIAATAFQQDSLAEHRHIGAFYKIPVFRNQCPPEDEHMTGIIYIVGLVVVVAAILSFFGLR